MEERTDCPNEDKKGRERRTTMTTARKETVRGCSQDLLTSRPSWMVKASGLKIISSMD